MINIERLSNLCLDISTEWNDIQVTYRNKTYKEKTITIPLIYTGSNGIYVFLEEQYKKDVIFINQELEKMFGIRGEGLYLFFFAENNDEINTDKSSEDDILPAWAYDSENKCFVELTDLYDGFDIFYYNHYIPQSELIYYNFKNFEDYFRIQEIELEYELEEEVEEFSKYVRPIIPSKKLEDAEKVLEEKLFSGVKKGKYTYHTDGTVTVKKPMQSNSKFSKVLSSYLEEPSYYDFPCSDEDGDKSFLMMVIGGWFGLHKFRDGKFWHGLLYSLSCGGFCMGYFIDVVSAMTGNYFIENSHYFRDSVGKVERAQTRTFYRPVKNKKLFLLVPLMAVVALAMLQFVYLPSVIKIVSAISSLVTNLLTQFVETEGVSIINSN